MSKRHKKGKANKGYKNAKKKKQEGNNTHNNAPHSVNNASCSPRVKAHTAPSLNINSVEQTWYFDALDTLFFRESRPMDSLGNSELGSLFPPSARTLIGAVRTALGEANNIDWRAYREQKQQHPVAELIGYGDDFASLHFSGVWIYKNGERLYPAPQNIMKKADNNVFFLTIADELTHCDVGKIRLPKLERENAGSKPLANLWLTENEFQAVLAGQCPAAHQWISLSDLLVEEPRIGIARDNTTRGVEKGKLYQTKHIRLADDVQLAIDVAGLDVNKWRTTAPAFIRLGGEGRMSAISVKNTPAFINSTMLRRTEHKLALYLLTPLLIDNSNGWQPLPDFHREVINQQTVWMGKIEGIPLTLHTAITGKAYQEGGWNLAENKPKAVQSYIPAGSVFYCTCEIDPKKDINEVITALHGKQIGDENNMGRGILAIGKWV